MGDKNITIGLKVTDNKAEFTMNHLKVKVAKDERVTITWELANDPGLEWWMNPAGIKFNPGWLGPSPTFENNRYSVTYTNTEATRGNFKYSVNVLLKGATDFTETLSFDPEVQNEPPIDVDPKSSRA